MMKNLKFQLLFFFLIAAIWLVKDVYSTNTTSAPTQIECEKRSASCETCLKNVTCLWCNSPKKCMPYPSNHILPRSTDCSLSAARWGVCWLNFEALIISMSIIGGVLLIGITLCFCKCCGCCCFGRNNAKYQAEEMRLERERHERSMRQDERKQERQRRNDDIRRKYGLVGGSSRYQRFEDEDA